MITIAIILALTAVFTAALVTYWKNIVEWIKKAYAKIKEVLGVAVQGVRSFVTKTAEGFKNKTKYYNENKLTGEWEETIYMKVVSESEIPPEILQKVRSVKIDTEVQTTDELKLAINA